MDSGQSFFTDAMLADFFEIFVPGGKPWEIVESRLLSENFSTASCNCLFIYFWLVTYWPTKLSVGSNRRVVNFFILFVSLGITLLVEHDS